MIYKFIDEFGTFIVKNPQLYKLYFPLINQDGRLLSSISPNLAGDIKKDNDHFLTLPASIEDLRSNLLCRRDFFVKIDAQTVRLSNPYEDTLEAGFLYQKMMKKIGALDVEILNFIPYNRPVEIMWVKLINTGHRPFRLIPTSFIPLYGRSEKNLRDHRHVSSLLNRITLDKYGILLKPTMIFDERAHTQNKSIYFVLGFEDEGKPPQGQFPTLDYFCGRGDLVFPDAIEKGIRPTRKKQAVFDGKEACAAFRFRERSLRPAEEVSYFLLMGIEEDKQKIKETFLKLNSPEKITKSLKATQKYWLDYLAQIDFDFKDKDFNNWLLWVKFQPVLRKLFGCSFLPHFDYGKGGRGWRDLWQDALTLLLVEPQKARRLILNNFQGVRIDGSNATVITKEESFLSDRNALNRVWMDHGVWPYLTCRFYLYKTADLNLLLEKTTYFRDHQQKRGQEIDLGFSQKDYLLRDKNNKVYQGTILEHILIQNLVSFFNVGSHNIIRLENADWNDGLDMAPERGEGVTFSFMYAHNLKDLCTILEKLKRRTKSIFILKELTLLLDRLNQPIDYDNFVARQDRLEEYLQKTRNISGQKIKISLADLILDLKSKSTHLFSWLRKREWLRQGFFNGYYDNQGRQVEGRINGKIRMMLPTQVFAIMSEGLTREQVEKIWVSIKRYLEDKKLGGFRLNTNFGSLYLDLGRAFGFVYGDKENGAIFNHMVVMLAHALYKQGLVKEGFEVFNSIYKMAISPEAEIYPMIPEYFNNTGRGLYHYLTGSASWYIYTLLEEILGIKFFWQDIILEPKLLPANFSSQNDNIEVKFHLDKKLIHIIFKRETRQIKSYKIKRLFLNERRILPQRLNRAYLIKKETLKKKKNIIEVYLE